MLLTHVGRFIQLNTKHLALYGHFLCGGLDWFGGGGLSQKKVSETLSSDINSMQETVRWRVMAFLLFPVVVSGEYSTRTDSARSRLQVKLVRGCPRLFST